jgi:hypothetical protein
VAGDFERQAAKLAIDPIGNVVSSGSESSFRIPLTFKFHLDDKTNCAYIRQLEAESDLRDPSPVAFARSAVTETRASAGFLGPMNARAK